MKRVYSKQISISYVPNMHSYCWHHSKILNHISSLWCDMSPIQMTTFVQIVSQSKHMFLFPQTKCTEGRWTCVRISFSTLPGAKAARIPMMGCAEFNFSHSSIWVDFCFYSCLIPLLYEMDLTFSWLVSRWVCPCSVILLLPLRTWPGGCPNESLSQISTINNKQLSWSLI